MSAEKQPLIVSAIFALILLQGISRAGNFYKELNLIGGYSDNDKLIGRKGKTLKNSVGFEYFDKFSDEYGDYLTVDVQVRGAYDWREDSANAFGLEVHNAWLDYKVGLGETLRLGHFDPAFGLEPVLDTHGTLLQTLALNNLGYKKDWGIGYRGLLGDFDYEIAAQLGTGMGLRRKDGSFLVSNRISKKTNGDLEYGISFLYGQTLESVQMRTIPAPDLVSGKSIRKKRIGLDLQCPVGPFGFKGEIAAGDDDGKTVMGALTEFNYIVPTMQNWQIKMQGIYWSNDWDRKNARDMTLSPVIEYKATSALTLRLGYFHDVYKADGDEDRQLILQLYYFGV